MCRFLGCRKDKSITSDYCWNAIAAPEKGLRPEVTRRLVKNFDLQQPTSREEPNSKLQGNRIFEDGYFLELGRWRLEFSPGCAVKRTARDLRLYVSKVSRTRRGRHGSSFWPWRLLTGCLV